MSLSNKLHNAVYEQIKAVGICAFLMAVADICEADVTENGLQDKHNKAAAVAINKFLNDHDWEL